MNASAISHDIFNAGFTCAEWEDWLNSDDATFNCATGRTLYRATCCSDA